MTREKFIEYTKRALAPTLKRRKLKNGNLMIFYIKNQYVEIPPEVWNFQPGDTCEAKRQERLAGVFFDLFTAKKQEVTK